MKKLFIITGLMFVLPFVANAASFVITPSSSGTYKSGDIITLRISVDPSGINIYTALLDAKFSPSTLEVVSFTLNDSMLAMKQAGDNIDNTNGTLVKTGGYMGGINSVTNFGTLVLRAKTTGSATLTINSGSKLLDENNANKQTGSQSVSFNIIADQTPVVVPKKDVQKNTNTNTETIVPTKKTTETKADTVKISDVKATSTQVASVVEFKTKSNKMTFWTIEILVILITFGVGYVAGRRKWF